MWSISSGPMMPVREAGEVLDLGGVHQRAAVLRCPRTPAGPGRRARCTARRCSRPGRSRPRWRSDGLFSLSCVLCPMKLFSHLGQIYAHLSGGDPSGGGGRSSAALEQSAICKRNVPGGGGGGAEPIGGGSNPFGLMVSMSFSMFVKRRCFEMSRAVPLSAAMSGSAPGRGEG